MENENTASDTRIRFVAQADVDTEALVSVERDGLALSWGLAASDTSNEPVLPVEDEYEEGAEIESVIGRINLRSGGRRNSHCQLYL